VSQYQKGKTNLDCTEARDSEWQCRQLGHMQICTSLQINNHASSSPLKRCRGLTKKTYYHNYYYAAFNVPCVGHADDESQARLVIFVHFMWHMTVSFDVVGGWVHGVSFSASGDRLAWVGHDSTITVVDAANSQQYVSVKY